MDFKNKTITDNTGRNRYDSKNGSWWELQPGTTEVRFIADSTNPAAQVTFKSRDAWLGL